MLEWLPGAYWVHNQLGFVCFGKYVSSLFFARPGLINLGRGGGRSRGVFFRCVLRARKVEGISKVGSTLQASKKRIPGRGRTSRYGPAGCRTLPVRALCRPDGRHTYVGRVEWSAAYAKSMVSSNGRSCWGTQWFLPSAATARKSRRACLSCISQL